MQQCLQRVSQAAFSLGKCYFRSALKSGHHRFDRSISSVAGNGIASGSTAPQTQRSPPAIATAGSVLIATGKQRFPVAA